MTIKDFILRSLEAYPSSSLTNLCYWFEETTGEAPPNFQNYHMRDALYRLERKGEIHRVGYGPHKEVLWSLKAN